MTDQLIEAIVSAVMILGLLALAIKTALTGPTTRRKGGKRRR